MTKVKQETIQLMPALLWPNEVKSSSAILNKATVMDFTFYPVTHDDVIEDIMEPIPIDIEDDLMEILGVGDLSCASHQRLEVDHCQPKIRGDPSSSSLHDSGSTIFWKTKDYDHRILSPTSSATLVEVHRFKPFHEEKWYLRYKELLVFYDEHRHAAVPHTYQKNPQLARWVKRQRRQHKLLQDGNQSTINIERLDLLNQIGFIWDSHDVNWGLKLDTLLEFRRVHGHSNVASNDKDKKLATWVKCQRRQQKLYRDGKASSMTPERIAGLEKASFEWEIRRSALSPTKKKKKNRPSSSKPSNVLVQASETLAAKEEGIFGGNLHFT
jgi:hypothetical protein